MGSAKGYLRENSDERRKMIDSLERDGYEKEYLESCSFFELESLYHMQDTSILWNEEDF